MRRGPEAGPRARHTGECGTQRRTGVGRGAKRQRSRYGQLASVGPLPPVGTPPTWVHPPTSQGLRGLPVHLRAGWCRGRRSALRSLGNLGPFTHSAGVLSLGGLVCQCRDNAPLESVARVSAHSRKVPPRVRGPFTFSVSMTFEHVSLLLFFKLLHIW